MVSDPGKADSSVRRITTLKRGLDPDNPDSSMRVVEHNLDPDGDSAEFHIFTVTTIRMNPKKLGWFRSWVAKLLKIPVYPPGIEPRTVGYYPTQEKAIRCVENDWGDLDEAGWYGYAVIERVDSGLYPTIDSEESLWYHYDHEEDKWKSLPAAPEELEYSVVGYMQLG